MKNIVTGFIVVLLFLVGSSVSYANTKNIITKTFTASGAAFTAYSVPGANFCVTGVEADFKTPAPDGLIVSLQSMRSIPLSSAFPAASKATDGWIDLDAPVCTGDGFKVVLTGNTTSGAVVDLYIHGFYMNN